MKYFLTHFRSVQEPNGHLLLHISSLEHLRKLLKGYQVILQLIDGLRLPVIKIFLYNLVEVRLVDGSLCDGYELLRADVVSHHHGQHGQQLLLADLVVAVQVVHPERKVKLLHPRVQLVLLSTLLDGPKVSQHPDKVLEVNLVFVSAAALKEESMNNSVPQGIDGQLGDSEKILSTQVSLILFVQTREPENVFMSGCYCELMLTCSSGIVRQHGPHHTQTLSPAHLLYSRSIWFWLKPVSSCMAMMSSGWSWRDDLELPMVMVSGECCYQGGWRDSDSPAAAYCSHTTPILLNIFLFELLYFISKNSTKKFP